MSNKIKVGILYGGRSPEHNISLLSAYNVVQNLDKDLYTPVLLPIDKDGVWHHSTEMGLSQSIQGLAKVAGLPCVGCGILGSSAGMDKDVTKRLLRDAGIGVADFVTLRQGYNDDMSYEEIVAKLGPELFIKPANLGSSVGVSFVDNKVDFDSAVKTGFEYDPKVIIEEKITGKEIECAVLGNRKPLASTIGEILPKTEWYTFENKYVDDDGAGLAIPAKIPTDKLEEARQMAIDTYINLECCGLTRVDMFLKEDGSLIVNEVNTLPGFTRISMYPKLWAHGGIEYQDLISKLIEYAIERHLQNNIEALIFQYNFGS